MPAIAPTLVLVRSAKRKRIPPFLLFALLAGLCTTDVRADDLPVTGLPIPELSSIDSAVLQIMETDGLMGCTVGVARSGRVVYQRGFGWRDESATEPMPENATMRLASTSKALVRQVILDLVADGSLDENRPVFDVGQPGGGILNLPPWPSLQDDRMGDITSRQLRLMTVYWERDYAWDSILIYEAMGFDPELSPPPVSIETMASYALGQEMLPDSDPGDVGFYYSNFNYNVLVLVIEEITGVSFMSHVRRHLLTRNMWVPATDLFIAHPFLETGLREPHYFSDADRQNVYDSEWPLVPFPYGGFNVEAMIGSSFIAMSAGPLLTFMGEYPSRWTGNMAGSSAIVKDSANDPEVDIVVLCNDTSPSGTASSKIAEAIETLIDNGLTWPSKRIDGQWVDWLAPQAWTGVGSYDVPYNSLDWAVASSTSGTKLQFHAGDHPFTGVLNKKLRLKAPVGTARIGTSGP